MKDESERLFYLGVGPLAAILLGVALIPLRGYTTASNFTFLFLALIIVIAEFGGRWAAVATALSSALSLDFFLTKPYLRLSIEDKNDIIAFTGLAICGLIAAAFGSYRGERIAALSADRKRLDLLHRVLANWKGAAPVDSQLFEILRALQEVFPLAAAVVRDERGQVLASYDPEDQARSEPEVLLDSDTLLPAGSRAGLEEQGLALPERGGRIPLFAGNRWLGGLEVWGNGLSASDESRRALSDVARLLAVLLAEREPGARATTGSD
jgi:K+-sensing histidine kinase KdpD